MADASALAREGVAIRVIKREMVSSPNCACKLSALVPASFSPRQEAAALLRVFFANNLERFQGDGGTAVFGYHAASEMDAHSALAGMDTAGAVHYDVTNGKGTLSIDTGDAPTGKRYVVSG
jgi:hypothetical protein